MPLVDLHLHTTVSDGVWPPEQLFAHLRALPIELCSVTDHDTMDAYPLPADVAAKAISGMEVDTKCDGATAHLLVFGISSPAAPLLLRLAAQREARRERMAAMVERLQRVGLSVTMQDVEAQAGSAASLGRPHLARALVKLGSVSSVQEAFDKHIADDRGEFVSLDRLESGEAIELAHASGAVVSAAHPCRLRAPASLERLCALGIDAIEVVHPTANGAAQQELFEVARAHRLAVTGGSDFHAPGPSMPGIELAREHVTRLLEALERLASDAGSGSRYAAERTGARVRSSIARE